MTAIVCSDLSFSWPDGARVLSGLTLSIGDGRTGLIGVNGSGKSTLLKLIAGELRPASGAVCTSTDVGYLPQAITLGTSRTVSDLLGITVARDALHAIEAGETGADAFAAVGAGKTTLLRAITGAVTLPGVNIRRGAVVGYLPQRLDALDDSLTVVDNVRAAAPTASVNEVRASLARFLFRGARADRPAGTLSGGERFRAVLAALLLAQPAPQLLLLDEPTNNLDMASVRQLSQALESYRGAIIIASHDVPFLRSAGITRWLRLDRDAGLAEIGPP